MGANECLNLKSMFQQRAVPDRCRGQRVPACGPDPTLKMFTNVAVSA